MMMQEKTLRQILAVGVFDPLKGAAKRQKATVELRKKRKVARQNRKAGRRG